MKNNRGISLKFGMLLLAGLLACGNAAAQGSGQASKKDDTTKTKQAQAVSKEVYERIQKAQEIFYIDFSGSLFRYLSSALFFNKCVYHISINPPSLPSPLVVYRGYLSIHNYNLFLHSAISPLLSF